jgi:ATP-dependent DNA helicase RecQ
MDFDKLLTEIESIVNSGTKINIDYYINGHVDEDKQDEILEFFMNDSESGSVEEALRELGEDDYTEDEIRLIRIKFLSAHGN